MRKVGGIFALVAGIFSIVATLFTSVISTFALELSPDDALGYFIGGIFVSCFVVIMAAMLMSTPYRWVGPVLMIGSVIAIFNNWGGGIVTICLVFVILGSIMSLFENQRKPVMA